MGDLWHIVKDFTGMVLITIGRAICGAGYALACDDLKAAIGAEVERAAAKS